MTTDYPHHRRFDVILFDLGSTLIYFDGCWPEVASQANAALFARLKAAGLILDEAAFLEAFRQRLEAYFAERDTDFIEYTTAYILRTLLAEWNYPDAPDGVIADALQAMYRVSQAYWRPEADAIPTLEWLRGQGYCLGMISNAGDDADVQALVDKANIRPYFEVILTSAKAGIRKPHPRIFEQVLQTMGIPAKRAAMVGDTLGADISGGQNAGLFSIWTTRRADNPANRAHADTIHPDAVIETLSELPSLLEAASLTR